MLGWRGTARPLDVSESAASDDMVTYGCEIAGIADLERIVALTAMSALGVRAARKYVFAVSAEGLNYRVSWPAYCKTRNANLL